MSTDCLLRVVLHISVHVGLCIPAMYPCSRPSSIPSLFPIHSATGHLFADDTQAYVHGPPSAQLQLAGCIDALTRDLDLWMSSNRLSLNSSKTQLIWLGLALLNSSKNWTIHYFL